ncbi:MAG: DsbA family protein [Candidatus Binatia bacterium]|nr:DsbA family protein [Candidatus Binatia bacterium]
MASPSQNIVFYGDLNCPFCFAEYERLVRLGHAETVEWRGVEHAPRLPLSWEESTDADLAELDEEVRRVQVSAPEILIRNPRGRPNSRLAIATLAAIERVNSTAALAARVGLYRALWQEGRDISRPEVIREICEAVGLPGVDAAGEGRRRAKVWTIEWTHGPFDRRIPVLTGETQERLLGLAGPEQLARFLETPFDRLSYQDACREELLHANRKKG